MFVSNTNKNGLEIAIWRCKKPSIALLEENLDINFSTNDMVNFEFAVCLPKEAENMALDI